MFELLSWLETAVSFAKHRGRLLPLHPCIQYMTVYDMIPSRIDGIVNEK